MSYVQKLLGANERIVFATKRHAFVLLGRVLKEILVLAVIAVGIFAVPDFPQKGFLQIALMVVGLIALISMAMDFLKWQSEGFFITNRRVIHGSGVFSKKILDSSLSKINDVIMEQSLFGRMFGYGTIRILTASDEVINLLDRIAHPVEFKQAMLNAKAETEPLVAGTPAAVAAPSATQLLDELAQLRQRNVISDQEYEEKRKEILKRM
jgi:uncharacterized membrane protein YdbT with pleckstrin-like domain